jgi:hypothetical protein
LSGGNFPSGGQLFSDNTYHEASCHDYNMSSILSRAYATVARDTRPATLEQLRRDSRSRVRDKRVAAMVRIRKEIDFRGLRNSCFAIAEPLTIDADSTCRWQATIVIGEFIETQPDRVWRVARALGESRKADIRMASTTVLLEHLLEFHPSRMCKQFEEELSVRSNRLAQSIGGCWNFGEDQRAINRIQKVIDAAKARVARSGK